MVVLFGHILLLVSSFVATVGAFNVGNNFIKIEGTSFSLISIVKSQPSKDVPVYKVESYESYSAEQKRAKIRFKLTVEDQVLTQRCGIWMVDLEQKAFLEYDNEQTKCSLSSSQQIQDSFNFYLPDSNKTAGIDEYVVGPARVMLFVEKHFNQMKLDSLDRNYMIRNLLCHMYRLVYVSSSGEKIQFEIYYSELAVLSDQGAHPVQIVMSHDKRPEMTIDYLAIKQITPFESDDGRTARPGNLRKFDTFMFKPVAGCSKALEANQIDLFASQTASEATKFSFDAYLEVESGFAASTSRLAPLKSFVAYDAGIQSMRIDTMIDRENQALDSGLRRQILNFKLNRMYHTIERNYQGENDSDRRYNSYPGAANNDNTQCVVSQLMVELYDRPPLTIGQLLSGADKFVYMGRAQVRGINAKVYEATGGLLPYWLEQPIVYNEKETHKTRVRYSDQGVDNPEGKLKGSRGVLLYFGEKDANHPLLLIEIYKIDSTAFLETSSVKSIHVYDFIWDLADSSEGDRAIEMFSLRDSCTDYKGSSAKIEMLLVGNETFAPIEDDEALIFSSKARNSALLSGLQKKLALPATMVFNLESKLLRSAYSQRQTMNFFKIVLNFNIAAHVRSIRELTYIGRGRRNGAEVMEFVRSFEECYHLAAYSLDQVYFGYFPRDKTCYIDFTPITIGLDMAEKPSFFELVSGSQLEIYRTGRYFDDRQIDYADWVKEVPVEQINLLGYTLVLENMLTATPMNLAFTIMSVQKEFDGPFANKTTDSTNSAALIGFALLESNEGNMRIWPAKLQKQPSEDDDDLSSAMSFEKCHATCLSDNNCQSFSVCLRNSEVECMISRMSFNSKNVLEQFEKLTRTTAPSKRFSGKVKITLDDERKSVVELARHPNCELRNKNYLELFHRRRDIIQLLGGGFRQARAASSRAECAEMCFANNINILKQDVNKIFQVFSKLDNADKQAADDPKEFKSMLESHKRTMKQICNEFFYLDRQQLSRNVNLESKFLKSILIDKEPIDDMRKVGGFCMTFLPSDQTSAYRRDELYTTFFTLEEYSFKTDILYEKQYRVRLRESKMSNSEFEAYRKVKNGDSGETGSAQTIVKSMLARGYNFQSFILNAPSECAHACFTQTTGLWPACRSFDIVEVGIFKWCLLNSLTLSQIKSKGKTDMIFYPEDRPAWHYEPRAGFILEESILGGNVEVAENSFLAQLRASKIAGTRFHFFGCLIIVLIGLTSGIMFGLLLGRFISNRRHCGSGRPAVQHHTDIKGLVGSAAIEFSNQVNSDGQIPLN